MSPLVYTLLRLGFLALLWLFVFAVVATVRRDVHGIQLSDRRDQRTAPGQQSRSERRRAKKEAKAAAAATPPAASIPPAVGSAPRPAAQDQRRAFTLVVTDGPLQGTALQLTAPIVVGRSPDCALVLNDSYSSSRHARIYPEGGSWWIEDLDSTNGTYVAGERISLPTRLMSGMPITIGRTNVEIR